MRNYDIKRKTAETDIALSLDLDGSGKGIIDTGCGFLDHMLTLFSKHAHYDLSVKCVGDTNVDYIDGETLFAGEHRDSCAVDGCHPNDLGYHYMANAFEKVIRPILEK